MANRAIADALAEPPAVPVSLKKLGPLRRLVGELHAVPRVVTLSPAGPGKVRITFTVELRDRHGELVTFDGHAEVEPVLEHTDTVLSIGLDPRRIEGVELDLGPRASARLRDALLRRVPGALRGRVPGSAVGAVASTVVEELGEETWKVLRRTLLPRIDALTHRRPLVVSVFQLDRGCSCFSAGVRPRLEVRGDRVIGTIEEKRMELALGPPHIETLAWLKDVVDRSIQRSRDAAAHTELTVGERTIRARLVDAGVDRAQLHVAVRLAVGTVPI